MLTDAPGAVSLNRGERLAACWKRGGLHDQWILVVTKQQKWQIVCVEVPLGERVAA